MTIIDPTSLQRGGPGKSHHSSKWLFNPSEEHTDALLRLATTTFGELSPASARAALRRTRLEGAVAVADLAAGARLLAEQARVLEVAAGSAARTAGMDASSLAIRTRMRLRTAQERYREHRVRVEEPSADPLALLVRDAQGQPRPVSLELDLRTGRFAFGHPQEPDRGEGRVLRWAVPLLTGPGARTLLQALHPLALRVLVGTEVIDNQRVPDDDAHAATEEIDRVCTHAGRVYPVLRLRSAAEHFADQDPADIAAALGLAQGAGPGQVAAAADLATENALRLLVVLTGAGDYLRDAVAPGEVAQEEDLFAYARGLLQDLDEPIDGDELWLSSLLLGALLRAAVTEEHTLEQALQHTVPYWLARPTLDLPTTTLAARPGPETTAALVTLAQYEDADEQARERVLELARRALPTAPVGEEAQEE